MAVVHWNRPAEADRPSCGHGRSLNDLAGPEASERHAEAIASAERAIKLATALGLPAPARALEVRGSARFALGDAGGRALQQPRRGPWAGPGTAGTAGVGARGRGLHPAAGDRRMDAATRPAQRALPGRPGRMGRA